jgi:hypothetical protein
MKMTGSKNPLERAEAIKKLEERWLVKSKEKENLPTAVNSKKNRTSLTNPVVKNKVANSQSLKSQ